MISSQVPSPHAEPGSDSGSWIARWLRCGAGFFGAVGLGLAFLATAFAIEGWAVKGGLRGRLHKTVEVSTLAKPEPRDDIPMRHTVAASTGGSALDVPPEAAPEPPQGDPELRWPGTWLNGSLHWLGQTTRWLSHGLFARDQVEWGDIAGALGGAAGALITLATVMFAYMEIREQLSRADEQIKLSKAERALADKQLALLSRQARVSALTAQLQTARSRVETLWKGSSLDFDRQVHQPGHGEIDRITHQITEGMASNSAHYHTVRAAVEKWIHTGQDLEQAIEQWNRKTDEQTTDSTDN